MSFSLDHTHNSLHRLDIILETGSQFESSPLTQSYILQHRCYRFRISTQPHPLNRPMEQRMQHQRTQRTQ